MFAVMASLVPVPWRAEPRKGPGFALPGPIRGSARRRYGLAFFTPSNAPHSSTLYPACVAGPCPMAT